MSTEPGTTLPPGWPDAATMERLANDLFSTVPAASAATPPAGLRGDVPAGAPPAGTVGPIANDLVPDLPMPGQAPIAVDLPGEPELRVLLQELDTALDVAASAASPFALASAPAFYFLEYGLSGALPAAHDAHARAPLDVHLIRRDFPILSERVNGRPLVWLDNAATTQKPRAVIDRLQHYYQHENSNIHRAAHELAARSTDAYEAARETVRAFLHAPSINEIVFVRGTTEAINLVAQSWGRQHIGAGDEIVISWLEHHANIVPWQQLAHEVGARLRVIPVDETGQILLDEYSRLLGPKTKLVSFAQVSNALGTITPAKAIIDLAHSAGAKVLLDGAQAVSHLPVDVQALDPDWYVFSGHKVFGPTGIGALYGREGLLNATQPWQGGGNMIRDVTFERTVYQNAPARLEAGTGNIADAVGLGAAIDYITRIGLDAINEYEHQLLAYATRLLTGIPGLRLIGTAADKAGVLSFVLDGYRTEDIGTALNQEGIAVRAGHHCAQPILRRFGVEATVRASLALYNTFAEIDALVSVLTRLADSRSTVAIPAPASPGALRI